MVRDYLELPIAVENVSSYTEFHVSEMTEWEFLSEVVERADCGLLLDVNNVFVNARNHGFDPREWLSRVPLARVAQLHIAGHELADGDDDVIIDTHGAPVRAEVDELLAWVIERLGPVPVLLERDNNIPELDELLTERDRLAVVYNAALARWCDGHV